MKVAILETIVMPAGHEVEFDRICKYCNVHLNDIKLKWGKDDYPGIKQEIEKLLLSEKMNNISDDDKSLVIFYKRNSHEF